MQMCGHRCVPVYEKHGREKQNKRKLGSKKPQIRNVKVLQSGYVDSWHDSKACPKRTVSGIRTMVDIDVSCLSLRFRRVSGQCKPPLTHRGCEKVRQYRS